jgi:uncharacterized membrane protein
MPTVEEVVLWGHIAAGVVAILAGVGAIATEKGGQIHRRVGRVFVYAMAVVVGTVFPLLALDPTTMRVFLALVAVFSGYFAFSGYRVLSRKRPSDAADSVDWAAAVGTVVACLALGGWGVVWLLDGRTFGIVMAVFGGIGLFFGTYDLRAFRGTGESGSWIVSHLQRMLAAFIATVSAVSAVNLTPTLGFLAWLWPTIVGVPLITYWSWKYD